MALQLKYSREFESEADELGAVFMARAGFDPAGMGRFFERIVAAEIPGGIHIPPYLYSHPDLAQRIDGVKQRAATLRVAAPRDPALEASFRDAQARLALLLEARPHQPPGQPALRPRARATRCSRGRTPRRAPGARTRRSRLLDEAERLEPNDPRLPFRRGELLDASGRTRAAIAAWRRAVALDPSVALAYYQLGNACKALGDRHDAAYYFEQAERRFKPRRPLPAPRPARARDALLPAGHARRASPTGAPATAPRPSPAAPARPTPRATASSSGGRSSTSATAALRNHVRVRWSDPSGATVQDELAETLPKSHVAAHLALGEPLRERYGVWRVEAVLGGQVIDRRSFAYQPATDQSSRRLRASSAQLPSGRSPR